MVVTENTLLISRSHRTRSDIGPPGAVGPMLALEDVGGEARSLARRVGGGQRFMRPDLN